MPRTLLPLAGALVFLLAVMSYRGAREHGPVLQVETRHPIVGIHTRLTDEVEEWKIQRTLAMVREMGAPWIVEYFPWSYLEPARGVYDWHHADLVIDHAVRQGLTVIARVDGVPAWARPQDTTHRYVDATVRQHYASFVGAFARHYQGKVRYYVVWNEPNTSAEWGFRPVNAGGYVELLKAAHGQIKAADPNALVLSAGLAPTLERSSLGLDDLVFLQQMYDAGAKDYFDILNIHAYGLRLPPDDPPAADRINYARALLQREIMVRNGDAGKAAMITEGGWNDHPRWTRAVRPAQRAAYTVRALQKTEQEWPWVQAVAFWMFRLPAPARNYNDYYQFVGVDFRPKLVYEAVRDWARHDTWPGQGQAAGAPAASGGG